MARICCLRFPKRCLPVAELGPVTCAGCALLCDDVLIERSGDDLRLLPHMWLLKTSSGKIARAPNLHRFLETFHGSRT